VPVYVAETARQARDEPEASAMHFYRSIGQALAKSTTTTMRTETGNRLIDISYDEVLRDFAVYGTPEAVADRLLELREALGYSRLSVWMNSGGQVPHERVLTSMRLFAERVMPRLG
jgi:alkanesulfonate monooxygenase SsuD/methylene tetrahydromethanopterin reductase-like flavin-dependent oxidoreductase (luciferase family)